MNSIFHFLMSYLMVEIVFHNANEYVLVILIASVLIDLDHIPYILRNGSIKLGAKCRSLFHELPGMTMVAIALSVFSFFLPLQLVQVIALSIVLHLAVDFMVGHTRPMYPFSSKIIFIGIVPVRWRARFELASTMSLGTAAWLIN